jgi:hypothetical protein
MSGLEFNTRSSQKKSSPRFPEVTDPEEPIKRVRPVIIEFLLSKRQFF